MFNVDNLEIRNSTKKAGKFLTPQHRESPILEILSIACLIHIP